MIGAIEIYKTGELQKLGGRGKNKYSASGSGRQTKESVGLVCHREYSTCRDLCILAQTCWQAQPRGSNNCEKLQEYVLIAPSVVDRDGWVVAFELTTNSLLTWN